MRSLRLFETRKPLVWCCVVAAVFLWQGRERESREREYEGKKQD